MKKVALALVALALLSTTACKKDSMALKNKSSYDQKDNTGWDIDGDGGDDTTGGPGTTPDTTVAH